MINQADSRDRIPRRKPSSLVKMLSKIWFTKILPNKSKKRAAKLLHKPSTALSFQEASAKLTPISSSRISH